MAAPIDKGLFCLEHGDITVPYFCYPVNAEPIGFEGCILYCFLPEYGEMVFACNPESCSGQNVYPSCSCLPPARKIPPSQSRSTRHPGGQTKKRPSPVEQIVWMDKRKFEEHMASEEKILTDKQKAAVFTTCSRLWKRTGKASSFHPRGDDRQKTGRIGVSISSPGRTSRPVTTNRWSSREP